MSPLRPSPGSHEPDAITPIATGEATDPHSVTARRDGLSQEFLAGRAAWVIVASLVVYLGMKRGGYEQPVYSEIGIVAWWFVGVGTVAGALSVRIGRAGWIGLALLAAFAGWTAAGVSWSESSGRSAVEVARVVVYLGVFAAALLLAGRERIRLILGAVATGIAVVAAIALLSRLEPGWFPENRLPEVLIGTQSRLAYPVGYWNALAGLIAIGLPLLLWAAVSARAVALRGLAASAVPVVLLASYFTYSRAGIVAMALALLVFVALSERRLSLLPPLTVIGTASAVLIWQASVRGELADGLTTAAAMAQGEQMLLLVGVLSPLAGLIVAGLALETDRGYLPRPPRVPRATALGVAVVLAVLGIGAFIGLGGVGAAADAYAEFKDPDGLSETSTRLDSFAGNGRWQYWTEAVEANSTAPFVGIGPGTFVFWWTQNRDIDNGLVRDAHSLFIETLGELGIVGLVLLASFVMFLVVVGGGRALESSGGRRLELAAATAAVTAFTVAAALDWVWELAVVPAAFLLVAATILRSPPDLSAVATRAAALGIADLPRPAGRPWFRGRLAAGVATMIVALASIFVIFVTYESDRQLIESQEAARAGDLERALSAAESATDLLPFAGEPRVQQALVLEEQGELGRAAEAAREATQRESTNWETWFVLARIQRQQGKVGAALTAFRRAQELNPISQVLNPVRCDVNPSRC